MPRKAKTDTATKTKTKAQGKTKTQKAKATVTQKPVKETPKGAQIILEYSRNGNIGLSRVVETVNIPFLTQKKFSGKITTLFHFIRQTEVCKSLNSGRIATFMTDGKPLLSLTQRANDYDEKVFSVTKYKADGTKQSTRKYDYGKTRNLILQAYGFEIKIDVDEDLEDDKMLDIDSNTEVLLETDFEDNIDNGFNDVG